MNQPSTPLLDVRDVRKSFSSGGWFRPQRKIVAAKNVSFGIARGEAVALVGESGSGKSTIARLLLRLETPDAGEIRLDGEDMLAREPRRASLGYRSRVQMIFQDPFGSLNPVHDVFHHLARPLLRHGRCRPDETRERALALLRDVGLAPAEEYLHRHPYELSGGQRQRVAIARALAVEPDVLVADEPTSMLDVSIRMDVLNLLRDLKDSRGLAILLITHDLASARHLADRVLVLFRGRVVEEGRTIDVTSDPRHPYTQALLDAIRRPDGTESGGDADDSPPRDACPFITRCPVAIDACTTSDPEPRPIGDRSVRCHLVSSTTSETVRSSTQ